MSKTPHTWPTRRIATVTLRLDEESYKYLLDHLESTLDYHFNWTPQTQPLLLQMRDNVTYTTLVKFPEKEAAE